MDNVKITSYKGKKIESKSPKLDYLIETHKISNIKIIDSDNNFYYLDSSIIMCSDHPEHNINCWIELISLGIQKTTELNFNSLVFPVPFSINFDSNQILIELESKINHLRFNHKDVFDLYIQFSSNYSSPYNIQKAYRSAHNKQLLEFQMLETYPREELKEKVENIIREQNYWDDKNTIVTPSALSRLKYEDRRPDLNTIASIALGCHLTIEKANKLFNMFGYSLSPYFEYDQIVSEFLEMNRGEDKEEDEKKYSIDDVNEKLLKSTKEKYNKNKPFSKYRYYEKLVGTPDYYRVTLLKVGAKEKTLTEDQFECYIKEWNIDKEDIFE